MAERRVLKMGDPRLNRVAQPVEVFDTEELHALVTDLWDTMAARSGAGIAAPQIGVDLRVVVFAMQVNPRYPNADPVPETVLINPVLTPVDEVQEYGWEGCLSVPGMAAVTSLDTNACAIPVTTHMGMSSTGRLTVSMLALCSTSAIT